MNAAMPFPRNGRGRKRLHLATHRGTVETVQLRAVSYADRGRRMAVTDGVLENGRPR